MAREKNECGKTRKIDDPYEIWTDGIMVWKVLKKYQAPLSESKNPYARWFCFVVSQYCPNGEYGDVYVSNITEHGMRVL